MHLLWRVPVFLPGVPDPRGWPRLRECLRGSDRSGTEPVDRGSRGGREAAVFVLALRGLRRCLPGQDPPARHAGEPASTLRGQPPQHPGARRSSRLVGLGRLMVQPSNVPGEHQGARVCMAPASRLGRGTPARSQPGMGRGAHTSSAGLRRPASRVAGWAHFFPASVLGIPVLAGVLFCFGTPAGVLSAATFSAGTFSAGGGKILASPD